MACDGVRRGHHAAAGGKEDRTLRIRRLGVRVPSGAQKIKAVTSGNARYGLDSFPRSAAIFQIVGAWCSDGAPPFPGGLCRGVLTSAFCVSPSLDHGQSAFPKAVHCGHFCGSRNAASSAPLVGVPGSAEPQPRRRVARTCSSRSGEVGARSREVEADHRVLVDAVRLGLMQDGELRPEVVVRDGQHMWEITQRQPQQPGRGRP
jgi:hypothetical protein